MSPEMIGIIGIIGLLVLFILRIPVSVSLIIVGTVGLGWIRGWDSALVQLGTTPFSTASSYSLSVIPLFILMGMFLSYSGFGNDLYRAVDAWIGHIKGGLAITTIGTSAMFSAISGSVNATTATMAKIALPEMKKYRYDDGLSTSCSCGRYVRNFNSTECYFSIIWYFNDGTNWKVTYCRISTRIITNVFILDCYLFYGAS